MAEPIPRRRKRSRREADADPGAVATDPAAPSAAPPEPDEESASERGLRGLIGGGSSQVSVGAALRARDATRPSPEELANAAANLMIIRRGWTPPAEPR